MPRKIFISYRREDTAATAIGIGQYFAHTFGTKNVFIDIDMSAGTKFPTALEQRLAECRVMLVLIGPDWLNARDERGDRRLDNPDDWVRLEISQALKRNIVVIPVRVDRTPLPAKDELPEDIRGLLDHQAVSVTVPGFRNEMLGLVRDIRAISEPGLRRKIGTIAAGVLLLLTAVGLGQAVEFSIAVERIRGILFPQMTQYVMKTGLWSGVPGEWIFFATDNNSIAYYYKLSSVKRVGDYATYTARFPLPPTDSKAAPQAAYADDTTVLDCKKSTSVGIERVTYNKAGDVAYRYKWGTLDSFKLLPAAQIQPNTIMSLAAPIICNEEVRRSLLLRDEIKQKKLTHLSMTPAGDGELFYGGRKRIAESRFDFEVLVFQKNFQDRRFRDDFPGKEVIGLLQGGYRAVAQTVQLNCRDQRLRVPIFQVFDSQNVLVSTQWFGEISISNVPPTAPFKLLFDRICVPGIPQVQGVYEGMNHFIYQKGDEGDQLLSLTVEQDNANITVSFLAANGAQGMGTGTLIGSAVKLSSIKSLVPECAGSLNASLEFAKDAVSWSYKGEDCNGLTEGRGTAKKTR